MPHPAIGTNILIGERHADMVTSEEHLSSQNKLCEHETQKCQFTGLV